MLNVLAPIFDTQTLLGIFLQGSISGCVGIFAGYLLLKILKSDELSEIELAFSRKFRKLAGIIPPEQDVVS